MKTMTSQTKKLQRNSLVERSRESLLESLRERRKANPQKFYVPNGVVTEFVELLGQNEVFVCLLSAGNGVGKTAAGATIVSHILFGNSGNKYFDFPLFNNFPYPKRGRIVSDTTTIQEVIVPELKKWLPEGRYANKKKGKNYEYTWYTDTRHRFELMTYEQEAKEFESATLGWAWFDEPPPLAIFKATVARMRRGGIIFITATPLTGSAWMYDHIYTYKSKENEKQRAYIEASIEANCITHGVRGILKHSDILRMVAEYDDEDKQARIYGKFQHLMGLVFKNFKAKIHVIKPFKVTKEDYMVLEALDPHPRNPDAVMWLAKDKKGTNFVIDELYGTYTTPELADRIHKKDDRYRIEERIADPAAFIEDKHQANPQEQTLAARLYNDHGLNYMRATKDRQAADRKIKDSFDYRMSGDELLVAPELYIFDTCMRTIWEIEHYQWDDWRGRAAERKSPKEKPMDKDDHMIENLGRLVLLERDFVPVVGKRASTSTAIKTEKSFDPYD